MGREANQGEYMAVEKEIIEEKVIDPVVDNQTKDVKPEVELKFEDLDPEIQKFVDRERNRASMTAREKAKRDALSDTDIRNAIKSELEAEATLTVEQKLERRSKEIDLKSNRLEAREKLVAGGLVGDDLGEALELVVGDTIEQTLARVEKFLSVVKKTTQSEVEKQTREALRKTPKPQTQASITKDFKEMGFEDRMALKEKDYPRYKAEMEKLRTKI